MGGDRGGGNVGKVMQIWGSHWASGYQQAGISNTKCLHLGVMFLNANQPKVSGLALWWNIGLCVFQRHYHNLISGAQRHYQ